MPEKYRIVKSHRIIEDDHEYVTGTFHDCFVNSSPKVFRNMARCHIQAGYFVESLRFYFSFLKFRFVVYKYQARDLKSGDLLTYRLIR